MIPSKIEYHFNMQKNIYKYIINNYLHIMSSSNFSQSTDSIIYPDSDAYDPGNNTVDPIANNQAIVNAVNDGNSEIVKYLIKIGVDIEQSKNKGPSDIEELRCCMCDMIVSENAFTCQVCLEKKFCDPCREACKKNRTGKATHECIFE